jgi:hypothetical protein
MKATVFCVGIDPQKVPVKGVSFPASAELSDELASFAANLLGVSPQEELQVVHHDADVVIISEGEYASAINHHANEAAKEVADTLDGRSYWDEQPIWGNCLILERK